MSLPEWYCGRHFYSFALRRWYLITTLSGGPEQMADGGQPCMRAVNVMMAARFPVETK